MGGTPQRCALGPQLSVLPGLSGPALARQGGTRHAARLAVGRGVHGGPLDAEISRLSTVTQNSAADPTVS